MEAREIRQLRRRMGITQARLGELIGVHRITVVRWESGHRPTPGHCALLRALRANPNPPAGRRQPLMPPRPVMQPLTLPTIGRPPDNPTQERPPDDDGKQGDEPKGRFSLLEVD